VFRRQEVLALVRSLPQVTTPVSVPSAAALRKLATGEISLDSKPISVRGAAGQLHRLAKVSHLLASEWCRRRAKDRCPHRALLGSTGNFIQAAAPPCIGRIFGSRCGGSRFVAEECGACCRVGGGRSITSCSGPGRSGLGARRGRSCCRAGRGMFLERREGWYFCWRPPDVALGRGGAAQHGWAHGAQVQPAAMCATTACAPPPCTCPRRGRNLG
jgi:hypothetical protein